MMLLAALVVALMAWSNIGLDLERGLQSWRNSMRHHAASGRLVFVEIDAKSLAALDQWPWPRNVYVGALDALGRGGAQAVAFDVDFSARSIPANDAAFAKAIADAPMPIVLPTFRQAASEGEDRMIENLPIPELRRHAVLASVNIYADGDGLVRSYPYGIVTGGVARPSISAFLANSSGRSDRIFPIDGSIDPASVPRISFIDLLRGRVPPGSLAGRSVLIGASAIEMGDRYAVPLRGVLPGALVQLLAAETLVQDSAPVDHGPLVPTLLLLIVAPFAARSRGPLRAAILTGSALMLMLLPLAAEVARLGTFDIVPALVGLIAVAAALLAVSTIESLREARLSDAETGLPNRRALIRALPRQGTVVALRIANYNEVLGVLGPTGARELIARVVERLSVGSTIFRIEDAVLAWVDEHGDAGRTVGVIDGAAAVLRQPFTVAGRQLELVIGFGLAEIGDGPAIGQAILAAKHAVDRGIRYERYDAAVADESDWRLSIATEIDRAMAADEIWNAYQPKLDLRDERIFAAEALVRWRHPTRGDIFPDSFIPALEESGRIADLTLHVLDTALRDRAGWAAAGFDLAVAVNISALLPAEPGFIERLEAVLARHADARDRLVLEVTESAAMSDPEAAIAALERLSALGIKLSIDDYGTGQSTLSYLKRLPAREIKIDKGFVMALESSRSDQAMVRSTIDLAHELGFTVVAEGVETEASYVLLKSYGCDAVQGWFIGRPVESAAFLATVTERALAPAPERRIA
jgi:EAL domain-containing protein (putative c-di-GMP-specific phosphodiesterase class I)/CHASE2 domain-containing sensor protein